MWDFYAENAECFVFLQGDSSAALKSNSRISQALYIEISERSASSIELANDCSSISSGFLSKTFIQFLVHGLRTR